MHKSHKNQKSIKTLHEIWITKTEDIAAIPLNNFPIVTEIMFMFESYKKVQQNGKKNSFIEFYKL